VSGPYSGVMKKEKNLHFSIKKTQKVFRKHKIFFPSKKGVKEEKSHSLNKSFKKKNKKHKSYFWLLGLHICKSLQKKTT